MTPSSALTKAPQFWPEALLACLCAHALLVRATWAQSWLISGAAPLTYLLLAGDVHNRRILSWAPLWLLIVFINLAEAASSTSWLFFAVFTVVCWPLVFITSLFQFDVMANNTRRVLRRVLRVVHFAADTVALFDLPALEIDVDVAGMLVVRGVTLSLSSLTLIAHGVEVGIKLSDDLELALQTDKVTVRLFRSIDIGDVYGNVKGGEHEQTFNEMEPDSRDAEGEPLMESDTPMLRALTSKNEALEAATDGSDVEDETAVASTEDDQDGAATANKEDAPATTPQPPALPPRKNTLNAGQPSTPPSTSSTAAASDGPEEIVKADSRSRSSTSRASEPMTSMADKMTSGHAPEDVSAQKGVRDTTSLVADDNEAQERLQSIIQEIIQSSEIRQAATTARARQDRKAASQTESNDDDVDLDNERHMRAAICTRLHHRPSIQHPPRWSVRVTTLQQLAPPWLLRLFHRTPLLLRLLLNPIAYFHPVTCTAITAGASGKWTQTMLGSELFRGYADKSNDVRKLRDRVFEWLTDANFVFGISAFTGQGLVPMNTDNDITCRMAVEEITLYRTVPRDATLRKSIQLGGADATVLVPSMLLPHHDHLLPSQEDRDRQTEGHRQRIRRHDSTPKAVQAERHLQQSIRDQATVQITVHVCLPAVFDQDLLNFITTLVKASKIIEFERAFEEAQSTQVRSFKDLTKMINTGMVEGMKKATVNAAANDRWIAKMVGKVVKKLEAAHGDVGYSAPLPVPLAYYRSFAVPGESKLLA